MNPKAFLLAVSPAFLRGYLTRVMSSPLGHRLAKGTLWNFAGTIASRGLTLVSSMIVARMLGKVGFGELGIIHSTVGMFSVFAGLGLGLTATKHIAEFRGSDRVRAGRIIGLSTLVAAGSGIVIAATGLALSSWLATHTLAAPNLAGPLRIAMLLLLLSTVNGAQTGALAGFEAFKRIAQVNLVVGVTTLPLTILGVEMAGLNGAIWALTISTAISLLLNQIALRSEAVRSGIRVTLAGCGKEAPMLWRFSLPALLSGVIVGPVTWASNAILVNQPGGYSEMGIFGAANQWFTALIFLPGMIGQVVLPILSEQLSRKDSPAPSKILMTSVAVNALIVFPLVVVGSVLSPLIMSGYGAEFRRGWSTLAVALLTSGLFAIHLPVGSFVQALGKMWLAFLMNLGWAAVFLAAALFLAPHGALGLATSRALAYACHTLWTSGYALSAIRRTQRAAQA